MKIKKKKKAYEPPVGMPRAYLCMLSQRPMSDPVKTTYGRWVPWVSMGYCGFVCVWYCVAVWLCGCVAVWLCGCVVVWLCGCVVVWLCGCVAV